MSRAHHPEPTRCNGTTLAVANAIKYSEHNFPQVSHYSLTEPPRCSEIHSRYSECSQHQKLTRLSLLVAASRNLRVNNLSLLIATNSKLATASTHSSHQLSGNPNPFSSQTTYYKFCFAVDIKLYLPRLRKSPSFACEMLHALNTIDGFLRNFYNRIYSINISQKHHIQHS